MKAGANVEVIIQHVTPDYMLACIPRRSIPVAYIVGREVRLSVFARVNHGSCGHNLGVDRVNNTWPK